MDLQTLLGLITEHWETRFERGLVLHVHQNHLTLPDGSQVHLRVLVQRLRPQDYRKDTDDRTVDLLA